MKEQQAKQRYVTKVRALKTFGITFFECKQKLPGKKERMFFVCSSGKEYILLSLLLIFLSNSVPHWCNQSQNYQNGP